jgi:G6PDH family F420-dependent oxidoreductase
MTTFGYTLMGEQCGPRQLVDDAVAAEAAGFDFAVMSDHYFPWLEAQGHAPNAWVTLGAVAQATSTLDLMTYVTCPTMRYHPVVVAQQAATLGVLSDGRFTLGLGAGENLNEHVVGGGWPPADVRHEKLAEAVEIIRELFDGDMVDRRGEHYEVRSAKLWDLPERPVPIGIACSGGQSALLAGRLGDLAIATEPKSDVLDAFAAAGGAGKPAVGQLPLSFDRDRDAAVARAHEQFRWFGLGWKVNSELPGPASFEQATSFVTSDDVASSIPCGDDVGAVVDAVRPYLEAGFTSVALVAIGADTQREFLRWSAGELLPALREL